jgi:hypothetical protein
MVPGKKIILTRPAQRCAENILYIRGNKIFSHLVFIPRSSPRSYEATDQGRPIFQ